MRAPKAAARTLCNSLCPQESDWESRPLTEAQLRYAALDAFVLPRLWDAVQDASTGRRSTPELPATTPKPIGARARARGGARHAKDADGRAPVRDVPQPPPALPTVSSRALVAAALPAMLQTSLGRPLGSRAAALTSLAGEAARGMEVTAAGGVGLTVWADGLTCLSINTANSRPSAGRYRNVFWREARGELAGEVCLSLMTSLMAA